MIFAGIVLVFVVHNDSRCNCVRVQYFLMIDGKIAVVFSSV